MGQFKPLIPQSNMIAPQKVTMRLKKQGINFPMAQEKFAQKKIMKIRILL